MTYRKAVEKTHVDTPASLVHEEVRSDHVAGEEVVRETYAQTDTADRVGTTSIHESLAGRVQGILWAFLLALEALLALRFTLLAFGASTTSGFVDFVMDVSWPFVRPFSGAFADRTWDEGVIEVNTLLAMGVWFLVFALVGMVLAALLPNITASETRVHRSRTEHT